MMNLSEFLLSWNILGLLMKWLYLQLFLKKLPVLVQKSWGANGHEDAVGKYFSQKLFGQLNNWTFTWTILIFLFLQLLLVVNVISSPGPQWPWGYRGKRPEFQKCPDRTSRHPAWTLASWIGRWSNMQSITTLHVCNSESGSNVLSMIIWAPC